MTTPLWQPHEDAIQNSNMMRFMHFINERDGQSLSDFDGLYQYSLNQAEQFWSLLWDFTGIVGDKGKAPYIENGDQLLEAKFFPHASLNFAENLLRAEREGDALIFWGEDKVKRKMSWGALKSQVSQMQQAFQSLGIEPGDRVCAMMPNIPETVVAMLAATSLGAIWSSCSPDFGVKGVLDRFGQIEPKVFITCDGYYYNGKPFSIQDKLSEIVPELPSLQKVIVTSYIESADEVASALEATTFDHFIEGFDPAELTFTRLPFSHPLYILFSSGTTGAPKCIVHSVGGTLIQHLKEQQLHCDLKPGEHLFYFTTCGWMMWNWLVSALASEATLMLYDGSPFAPSGEILFDYAQAEKFDIFGTSAKYIDALKKAELSPKDTHDLSSVRLVCSTGSTLAPESYDYVYEHIKKDVHLASMSGGTDIVACFIGGNPLQAVWRGELQSPGLGMATDVFDNDAKPMKSGKGELVCSNSFPSMPIGFWNDPENKKYHSAYFARFENIWHHGDFAEWTEHGGMIIHGRSDATLNPGGVRIGTAEIYRQVEQLEDVNEAIVIGQDWDHDVRVVLFVVLKEGTSLTDELKNEIKKKIRFGASPRHVPEVIIQVSDIPRTKSGKITELAVRDIVHGREIKNVEALANPEALDFFKDLPELKA